MDPNIWGPKFWFSLHNISLTYPFYPTDEDKIRYKSFFELLQYVLPCVVCRVNYKENLKNNPIEPHLKNRQSLVYWVVDLHNMVNKENGKSLVSYKEFIKNYEKILDRKIYLEDPEPHITQGKSLSDDEWKKKKELKTVYGKCKNEINKYWMFIIILILLSIILFSLYMLRK